MKGASITRRCSVPLVFLVLFTLVGWLWLERAGTGGSASGARTGPFVVANPHPASPLAPPLRKPAGLGEKARAARARASAADQAPEPVRQRIAAAIQQGLSRLGAGLNDRPAIHPAPRGYGRKVLNPAQQQAIDQLVAQVGHGVQLQMDRTDGTLRYLSGNLAPLVEESPGFRQARAAGGFEAMATSTLSALSRVMNVVDPASEFTPRAPDRDELNMVHVRLDQNLRGTPVHGAQVIVHFDVEGNPMQVQGCYAPTPAILSDLAPVLSEDDALRAARQAVKSAGKEPRPPRVSRVYYWDPMVSPILTYQVDLTPGYTEAYRVFVSATSGSVVHIAQRVFSGAASGQAKDLLGVTQTMPSWQEGSAFLAIDTTLPMFDAGKSHPPTFTNVFGGVCLFNVGNQDLDVALQNGIGYAQSSGASQWDATAVSMMGHFRQSYSYFKNQHGRSSWDDQGLTLTGLIHAKFKNSSGQLYTDNAFFNPSMNVIVAGEGEKICAPGMLPAALDIIGHEYSHGVVDHSAAFKYENQSGALHEHMADYFGSLIENKGNWILGEDAMQGTGKTGWRDLSDPHNANVTSPGPKTMAEYENLPNTPDGDLGGVHVNSTIPSYAAYLFTAGPQGLGAEKAGKIVYRALTQYMTQNSDFLDYRRAVLSATRDLYPESTNVVAQAFDAAQILEGETAPPPTPVPATSGDDYALFLRAEFDPFWGQFMGYGLYQLSTTDYRAVASRYVDLVRPAVSGSGRWALYVGGDNNVYWTDGLSEEAWTDTGDIRTIAMSKDQRFIAFTTTDFDNTITVIDTTTEQVRTAELKIPTSGDPVSLSYADVMTFNCVNDTLFFDAWSEGKLSQTEYGSWVLCSLRLKDLVCQTVMPLSPGLQVGNPSLANTRPYSLVADYVLTQGNQESVGCVYLDLDQGQVSVLLSGLDTYATATFRGDDSKILFLSVENDIYFVNEAALTADRTALDGASLKQLLWSATPLAYPVGFRSGSYTPPAAEIVLNPTTLDFGGVAAGQSLTKGLTLQNSGNADLELIEVSIENGDVASYDFASAIDKVIPAGRSQTLNIAFHPTQAGASSVSLRIKSTAPGQADATARLQGQGTGSSVSTADLWQRVWQDYQDNYSYFDHKGVDWTSLYSQYAPQFAQLTADQFAEKLNSVLQVLHDWHVYVRKPDGNYLGYTGAYPRNYSNKFFPGYTGGAAYTNINSADVIWHTTLTNGAAYLYVDSFETERWAKIDDQTVETLFSLMANAPAIVLDYRGNNGGNEANASKLASHLTSQAITYGYVRVRVTNSVPYRFEDYQPKVLQPAAANRYAKPVVALIGRRNMSSAEWFTLMLKNCPNVVLMGDRTRGASGNPVTHEVPELNIAYSISRWIAFTERKTPFEDRGIEPALKLPAEQSYDDNLQRDYLLERAMDYVQWRATLAARLPVSSGVTDSDGDGVPDVAEFQAGTDPTDAKSWFGFQGKGIQAKPGTGVTLQWGSMAGRSYNLLRASRVTDAFTPIASNLSATPPANTYTDATATGNGPYFYRLELRP